MRSLTARSTERGETFSNAAACSAEVPDRKFAVDISLDFADLAASSASFSFSRVASITRWLSFRCRRRRFGEITSSSAELFASQYSNGPEASAQAIAAVQNAPVGVEQDQRPQAFLADVLDEAFLPRAADVVEKARELFRY